MVLWFRRSLSLPSLPHQSQCEHSHATPSQIQLPSPFRRSRYLPQGQSSSSSGSSRHCTLSCAQIRNPNPNPFSINDAQTDARPTSDLRAQAWSPFILRSQLCAVCGFHCGPFGARAWVIVGHCCCCCCRCLWFGCAAAILLARTCGTYAARLCCTFSTISVRCLWAECAFSVASVAHRHTHTHTDTHTNTRWAVDKFRHRLAPLYGQHYEVLVQVIAINSMRRKATTKCQNHLQVNLSSKENT